MKSLAIILASIALIALVTVFLIMPGLAARQVVQDELMAANILQRAIWPAQVQFQVQNLYDEPHPGVGEFGYCSELSGLVPTRVQDLKLLPEPFKAAAPVVSGYSFIICLPDGPDTAVTDPYPQPRHFSASAAIMREKYWVAYAVPAGPHPASTVFAIDQAGILYSRPAADLSSNIPWNALYGQATWGSPATAGWQQRTLVPSTIPLYTPDPSTNKIPVDFRQ
jgi:hypothetical protein